MSCTGKGTICNMGAEIGATTSTFAFDDSMVRYLEVDGPGGCGRGGRGSAEHLRPDPEVYENPGEYYDELIEIDLSTLEPHLNGPVHARPCDAGFEDARGTGKANGWPKEVEVGLIGSCTNSSYEDMTAAASHRASGGRKKLKAKTRIHDYARLRAGALHHRTRWARVRLRRDRRRGAGQCVRAVHRSVGALSPAAKSSEKNTIVHSFQPQLCEARGRQPARRTRSCDVAPAGDGARAGGRSGFQSDDRYAAPTKTASK